MYYYVSRHLEMSKGNIKIKVVTTGFAGAFNMIYYKTHGPFPFN